MYRLIYGSSRDEMTSELSFTSLNAALSAYRLTDISHWCALMDDDTVLRHNTDTGPVVAPRNIRGE